MNKKTKYEDGQPVTVKDMKGGLRDGVLEILASQVFIQFPEGDGIFMTHKDFFHEQTKLRRAA
jgi:hypothetical protein